MGEREIAKSVDWKEHLVNSPLRIIAFPPPSPMIFAKITIVESWTYAETGSWTYAENGSWTYAETGSWGHSSLA